MLTSEMFAAYDCDIDLVEVCLIKMLDCILFPAFWFGLNSEEVPDVNLAFVIWLLCGAFLVFEKLTEALAQGVPDSELAWLTMAAET